MDSAELLAQLADIHLPEPVSTFPVAPGWWLLAILVLAAALFAGLRLRTRLRHHRICAFALAELDQVYAAYCRAETAGQPVDSARLQFVNDLNAVLRRVALWHYPNAGVASLGGRAWVDFICEKGDASRINDQIAGVLREGRFMPHCDVDVEALREFGQQWIASLYRGDRRGLKA